MKDIREIKRELNEARKQLEAASTKEEYNAANSKVADLEQALHVAKITAMTDEEEKRADFWKAQNKARF